MIASFAGIFTAGILTMLSPCVLPMAPILVGGLVATEDASRWARLRATAWFALGFAAAFVALGLGVSWVVVAVPPLRPVLLAAGAITIALYGLRMTGLLRVRRGFAWMDRSVVPVTLRGTATGRLRAVALGAIFGLTWTPCAGPILGGVLTYVASRDAHAIAGASLLLAYAAGVATPLLLVVAVSEWATPLVRRLGRHLATVERITGGALVVLAAVMLVQIPTSGVAVPANTERAGVERLLFFHSEHCPTCRMMAAYLPELERACGSERWALVPIDVDRAENAAAVAEENVRAVPTVSLRDEHGREVVRFIGYRSEADLRGALERNVHVACNDEPTADDPAVIDGSACEVGQAC